MHAPMYFLFALKLSSPVRGKCLTFFFLFFLFFCLSHLPVELFAQIFHCFVFVSPEVMRAKALGSTACFTRKLYMLIN